MARGWAFVLVFLLAAAFLSMASVKAAPPEVTIIPAIDNKIISANSDFAIKVDPRTSEKPVRITWSVYNAGNIGVGSLPIVDGKGLCYFSESDGNATCGPPPFFHAGETELDVFVIKPDTITTAANITIPLNISPIEINLNGVGRQDNVVYMIFYMPQKSSMTYGIYKEDLTSYKPPSELAYKGPPLSRYEGNITLNPGVYYFAFVVNDLGNYGTALKRIEIPSSDFLSVQTDKSEYWKGGKIRISGSSSDDVTGDVRFPGGSKALDFTANASAGNAFYYDFYSESDWPDGVYEVRTSKPLVKSANFTITEFLELTPGSVSGTVNKSNDFSASLTLKNVRQNVTNVSFTVSGGMKEQYVTIVNKYLDPQESTAIKISISKVNSSIDGKITLRTTEGLELAIPVKVTVTEPGQSCPPPSAENALSIEQNSLVWSQDCMTDEEIRHDVTINNNGASALSDFSYEIDDTGDQSLDTLSTMGNLDIPVSGLSIGAGESKDVEISLTPSSAGKYQGIIRFISGGQSASLFVSLTCFGNITGDISDATEKLAKLNPGSKISDDINSDIEQAQKALALRSYAQANEYAIRAQAKISAIQADAGGGGVPKPMDFTWIAIIIVIAVVGVVFFLFIRSRKPKGEAEEGAEELETFG